MRKVRSSENMIAEAETYLEPSRIPTMDLKPLTIFAKNLHRGCSTGF